MLILLIVISFSFSDATIEKRALVYPVGGTYKVITAIAIPIEIGTKQALSYSINFQFQYVLPQNFSQLNNDEWVADISSRRSRNKRVLKTPSQQRIVYTTLERELNRHGFEGRQCLRNIICELASSDSYYFHTLYDQLVHILLLPRPEIIEDEDFNDFKDAFLAGKYGADCNSVYQLCPLNTNIFKIIENM